MPVVPCAKPAMIIFLPLAWQKDELLFEEGRDEPVVLPRQSNALYLVQRVRDESTVLPLPTTVLYAANVNWRQFLMISRVWAKNTGESLDPLRFI